MKFYPSEGRFVGCYVSSGWASKAGKCPVQGMAFGLAAISNRSRNEIEQEISGAAMTRVSNLRNIVELVNDRFDDASFSKQEFVHRGHEHIFHIGTNTCNQ